MALMTRWEEEIGTLEVSEIKPAISDPEWQRFRLSLKGLSTETKLERLAQWPIRDRQDQVRVWNYLNALKRGGQLDLDGRVRR